MNLQESIRRILREETEFTSKFRRRLEGFVGFVWNNYAAQYPCESETFEDFMNVLYGEIEMVIDEGDGEDGPVSNWLTYDEGVKYVNDYMIDDLREFYNKQCGE